MQVVAPALMQQRENGLITTMDPGTTLLVFLRSPEGKTLVNVDADASKLSQFTDTAGNDLLKAKPAAQDQQQTDNAFANMRSFQKDGIGSFPRISDDRRIAMVELVAPRTPAQDATSITIKGKLVVNIAGNTKTQTLKQVALKPGKLDLPDHKIEISEAGLTEGDEQKLTLEFKTDKATANQIASVRFLDDTGQPIKSQRLNTFSFMDTVQISYQIEKPIDTATLEFTFYDQLERVEVPVDMQVSLGL